MTTAKETWKALERRICEKLGGRRTPLSGSNSQHGTSSDCIGTRFSQYYFEIKLRQTFLHHKIFKDVEEKAKVEEDKIPILITHKKYENGSLVVLRMEDFLELIEKRDD